MILVTKQFGDSKSNYYISLVFELFKLRISLISFWLLLLQTHAISKYHVSKQTNKNASKSEKAHLNVSKCLWQH